MNRDRRLTSARRNRTLIHETGMGRESQSSFLAFAKGNSALMIEFHQFHIAPVDDIGRQNVCPGVPAVPVLMARAISTINSWQSWRSGVATAIATMSSTRADRDSGAISFTIATGS